ncbi:hypothetical protein L3Q82_023563, partial [Scortum barcoo]
GRMSSGHRLRDVEQQRPLLDGEEALESSSHGEARPESLVHPGLLRHGVRLHHLVPRLLRRLRGHLRHAAAVQELLVRRGQRGALQQPGRAGAVLPPPHHADRPGEDDGAVPKGNATKKYMESLQLKPGEVIYKCPKCCSIKPERAHHCSICKRCIRKMDHHCPWVNNCVGEKNQRFFVLFTMYIAMISSHALALCGYQFVTCVRVQWRECSDFSPPVTMMLMIFLCMEALLFLTFTAVIMFSTQLHSICNEPLSTEIERLKNEKPTWERPGLAGREGSASVFGGRPSLTWISPFAGLHLPTLLHRRTWRGGAEFSV